jgi:hypothetical protein
MSAAIDALAKDIESGQVSPAEAFALAEQICALAFNAQGGAPDDPDLRDEQWEARKRRHASGFEMLYCRIRNMAADFHREAIRRRDGLERGRFNVNDLDADKATKSVFKLVHDRVADWDY